METDALNILVTAAIWRAEQLEARGIPASDAWMEVSKVEEELAKALPVSEPEGRIARRGAVRAALKAGEYARAVTLTESYNSDKASPQSLKSALRKMLDDDDRAMARRFRYAAKHCSPVEARGFARLLREAGAFGLAA